MDVFECDSIQKSPPRGLG